MLLVDPGIDPIGLTPLAASCHARTGDRRVERTGVIHRDRMTSESWSGRSVYHAILLFLFVCFYNVLYGRNSPNMVTHVFLISSGGL